MNINNIYANIILAVPGATTAQMNKYILQELDRINAKGIESIRKIKITHPAEESGYPHERTDGQGYNYYPTQKCFVLPPDVMRINCVYIGQREILPATISEMGKGSKLFTQYYLTESGEMYFNSDIDDGETITISGRFGGMSVDSLSDRYVPLFTHSVIAGLSANEYKNPDLYAIHLRKAEESRALLHGTLAQTRIGGLRDGRLY